MFFYYFYFFQGPVRVPGPQVWALCSVRVNQRNCTAQPQPQCVVRQPSSSTQSERVWETGPVGTSLRCVCVRLTPCEVPASCPHDGPTRARPGLGRTGHGPPLPTVTGRCYRRSALWLRYPARCGSV